MQVVIDIPDEEYKRLVYIDIFKLRGYIENGTPLPKGHERLIILSESAVKREQTPLSFSCQNWISEVGLSNATVAIIEADKTETELRQKGESDLNKICEERKISKSLCDSCTNKKACWKPFKHGTDEVVVHCTSYEEK